MTYKFRQDDGKIITVTEYNTPIIWVDDNGHINKTATIKSQIKYRIHQRTEPFRNIIGINSMLKNFS